MQTEVQGPQAHQNLQVILKYPLHPLPSYLSKTRVLRVTARPSPLPLALPFVHIQPERYSLPPCPPFRAVHIQPATGG